MIDLEFSLWSLEELKDDKMPFTKRRRNWFKRVARVVGSGFEVEDKSGGGAETLFIRGQRCEKPCFSGLTLAQSMGHRLP